MFLNIFVSLEVVLLTKVGGNAGTDVALGIMQGNKDIIRYGLNLDQI